MLVSVSYYFALIFNDSFFFFLVKSVFPWIWWLAVGGSPVGVVASQSAADTTERGVGLCSASINIFQPILIRLFLKLMAL